MERIKKFWNEHQYEIGYTTGVFVCVVVVGYVTKKHTAQVIDGMKVARSVAGINSETGDFAVHVGLNNGDSKTFEWNPEALQEWTRIATEVKAELPAA